MNKLIIFALICVSLMAYYMTHLQICSDRFEYCYQQTYKGNGECGVYYNDRWEYNPYYALLDFINSWTECEGVLE